MYEYIRMTLYIRKVCFWIILYNTNIRKALGLVFCLCVFGVARRREIFSVFGTEEFKHLRTSESSVRYVRNSFSLHAIMPSHHFTIFTQGVTATCKLYQDSPATAAKLRYPLACIVIKYRRGCCDHRVCIPQ
jgi:hypothetical protein